ncbi:MAG: LuxR C-terminal-related transcriptional regulator [Dehalococcoidia bacterium]
MDGKPGRPPSADVLTPSEWEVVHMVRHGMTNRRIASQRGTSLDGVKFHLENIRAKIGAHAGGDTPLGRPALNHPTRSTTMPASQTSVNLGQIGQVAHPVKDLETAVPFFKDTLGMTHLFTAGQLAFFDCNGAADGGCAARGAGPRALEYLYFMVDDIHGSQATLSAKGVAFEGEPHKIFSRTRTARRSG